MRLLSFGLVIVVASTQASRRQPLDRLVCSCDFFGGPPPPPLPLGSTGAVARRVYSDGGCQRRFSVGRPRPLAAGAIVVRGRRWYLSVLGRYGAQRRV